MTYRQYKLFIVDGNDADSICPVTMIWNDGEVVVIEDNDVLLFSDGMLGGEDMIYNTSNLERLSN